MDILVSSNLERLLFDLSGENDAEVKGYMDAPRQDRQVRSVRRHQGGSGGPVLGRLLRRGGHLRAIAKYYKENGYLIDTHTAVAASVMEQYRKATGDKTVTVFVSTASPYKFCDHVFAGHRGDPGGRRRGAAGPAA